MKQGVEFCKVAFAGAFIHFFDKHFQAAFGGLGLNIRSNFNRIEVDFGFAEWCFRLPQ